MNEFLSIFHKIVCITQKAVDIFKTWLFHLEERYKTYHFCYVVDIIFFLQDKQYFFSQVEWFTPNLINKNGPVRAQYSFFSPFKLAYKLSTEK